VLDGNRLNAEAALDLTGLTSDYRYKQVTSWYQCRLLRLLWRRGGSNESFRWGRVCVFWGEGGAVAAAGAAAAAAVSRRVAGPCPRVPRAS
jgi:hypothetical protein